MTSEERPVKLRFFDIKAAHKCRDLARKLGHLWFLSQGEGGVWEFQTGLLNSTQRRDFISKWADLSMERIG